LRVADYTVLWASEPLKSEQADSPANSFAKSARFAR